MHDLQLDEFLEQKSLFSVNTEMDNDEVQLDEIREPAGLFHAELDDGDEHGVAETQMLGLCDDNQSKGEAGFWRRQFQREPTRSQRRWDWAFGVVIPVICFFLDPIVFKTVGGDKGILYTYTPFAYSLSYVSIIAMIAWLLWGDRLKWFSGVLAGLFSVGGLVSLAVGLVLFPFSLVGCLLIIGFLGFTPLITSIVYLRNSLRSFYAGGEHLSALTLAHIFLLTALFASVIPYVINVEFGTWINPISAISDWTRSGAIFR